MLSPKHHNKKRKSAWDHEGIAAFERVKSALADLAVLSFPMRGVETILVYDASDVAVSSALNQVIDGGTQTYCFFSKALTKTQKNYSVFDCELLSSFFAVKHFLYFLEDRSFLHIETDHLLLTYAMSSNFDGLTGRRLRQLQFISEYTSDIRYVKGEHDDIADCLSQPPDINAVFQNWKTVDLTEITLLNPLTTI